MKFWNRVLFVLAETLHVGSSTRPVSVLLPSRWEWFHYALPCIIVWSIFLLAFWPALLTYDSFELWRSVLNSHFIDAHSAFHEILVWLVTRLWCSPTWIAITQIVALAAAAGSCFAMLRSLGGSRWLIWIACILFALLPFNCVWVITIWTDIPFSITFLAITLQIVSIVRSDGRWLAQSGSWIWMGALWALLVLLKHNGFAVAFGLPFVLALVYRSRWRQILYGFIVAVGLCLIVKGPVYQVLNVETLSGERGQQLQLYSIVALVAAHIQYGTPMTDSEKTLLNQVNPLNGGWIFTDGIDSTLHRANQINWKVILSNRVDFLTCAWNLSVRRPSIVLRHIFRHSSMVWRIFQIQPGDTFNSGTYIDKDGLPDYIHPRQNDFGIEPATKIPRLSLLLTRFILSSQSGFWNLWQPATYLYFYLGSVAWAVWRSSNRRVWLIAAPVFLHTVFLVILIPAADSRYMYPVMLVTTVLWPVFYLATFRRDPNVHHMNVNKK
jgi:hypothetical protein